MSGNRRRGDMRGIICYSHTERTWGYWDGGICRDTDAHLPDLRARYPKAEVHVQGELFGPETLEAIRHANP